MYPVSVRTTLGLAVTLLGAASQAASAASIDTAPGFFFTTLPFNDTGTTLGAVNNITSLPSDLPPGAIDFTQVAGPDVFYTFIIGSAGNMTFNLTPQGATGYDASLYLLTGGTAGTNAFRGEDAAGFNGAETLTTGVLAPGTYYLVVDSFYSVTETTKSGGAYSLSVSGDAVLVPEPGNAALALTALAATSWRRRRRGAR